MALIDELRVKFAQERFEFSKHAVDQTILRDIAVQEIREAVAAGEVIEDYPDDKYGPSCLIYGDTRQGEAITHSLQLSFAACCQSYHGLRT